MNKLPVQYRELVLVGLLTLLALALRLWNLGDVPPGWRDDELINVLVISQNALDGDLAAYYPDASGHEGLYHNLVAGMLSLFGLTALGIRGMSVLFGTLTIPLTYLLGRRLFGPVMALTAATGLAISFWSLMYSRFGMRHISVVAFCLAAFFFTWRGLAICNQPDDQRQGSRGYLQFGLAGLFMGLGFYTYFASRGVPLIILAFAMYLALFQRPLFKRSRRGFLLMGLVTAVLALPLLISLGQQPESEARVAEVAVPLVEARAGNFEPLQEHIVRTLSMFHSDGDDEWLYNIPFRPVFGPVGALFFWVGVVIALWKSLSSLGNRSENKNNLGLAVYPFLLIWWLGGIAPGFVSVPAASLGHTIIAQPIIYLLAALPIGLAFEAYQTQTGNNQTQAAWYRQVIGSRWTFILLAVLLVGSIARRDPADYFNEWANRGMARFLYRADVKDLAHYIDAHPELADFGATSLLAGPWDREAFEIDRQQPHPARPRWYNPERAVLLAIGGERPLSFSGYPVVPMLYETWYNDIPGQTAGGYQLAEINSPLAWDRSQEVCFQNGLCWLAADYNRANQSLDVIWQVGRPLTLVEEEIISNPPPPGVYNGPRLAVFGQLLDSKDNFLAGDDGLWVDVYTLHQGDVFLQQHRPFISEDQQPAAILIGLYDPLTGDRVLADDGRDHIRIEVN